MDADSFHHSFVNHLTHSKCRQAKTNGGRSNASSSRSSFPATPQGTADISAGHDNTSMYDTSTPAGGGATSTRAKDSATPDRAPFGNAAASPSSANSAPTGVQEDLMSIEVDDKVEYQWPGNDRWYRCRVTSVTPGDGEKGPVIDLVFLGKSGKTGRVEVSSEQLEVIELLADGDLAKPGDHLDWE